MQISDCRKLERDFPEVTSQKMVDQCIDLGAYCNAVMNTGGRWSMERLVWYLVSILVLFSISNQIKDLIFEFGVCSVYVFQCRLKINKDKKVRNSKWHIMPLSPEQQIYAAIDVYVSIKCVTYTHIYVYYKCQTNFRLCLILNIFFFWF